jgi:hypothetical protein
LDVHAKNGTRCFSWEVARIGLPLDILRHITPYLLSYISDRSSGQGLDSPGCWISCYPHLRLAVSVLVRRQRVGARVGWVFLPRKIYCSGGLDGVPTLHVHIQALEDSSWVALGAAGGVFAVFLDRYLRRRMDCCEWI